MGQMVEGLRCSGNIDRVTADSHVIEGGRVLMMGDLADLIPSLRKV
jgi:hypothetical protein